MTHTPRESLQFLQTLEREHLLLHNVQLFFIPPFTSLYQRKQLRDHPSIWIGAQNMHEEEQGAYTGEISVKMLKELDIDLVLLGHSERRKCFNETDEALNKKVRTAIANGLKVILCIGETDNEKRYGIGRERLSCQLKVALHGVGKQHLSHLLIAYEPVWAIGSSATAAEPTYVATMHQWIKEVLYELFQEASYCVPIIYGGSVNQDNCTPLAKLAQVDGLFVGRAACQAEDFLRILHCAAEARFEKG